MTTRPTPILFLAALLLSPPAGHAADRGAELPSPVALCLKAWQEKEAAHGGGELTLFAHGVTDRKTYTLVELTLGSGEGASSPPPTASRTGWSPAPTKPLNFKADPDPTPMPNGAGGGRGARPTGAGVRYPWKL